MSLGPVETRTNLDICYSFFTMIKSQPTDCSDQYKAILAGLFLSLIAACSGEKLDNSQVFRMPISNEPPTLDWSLATDSVSFDILTNIMEGLTQYDSNMEPIPAIAKRWETSKNGKMIPIFYH